MGGGSARSDETGGAYHHMVDVEAVGRDVVQALAPHRSQVLGAELAFALQNSSTYQIERAAENASSSARLIIALSVLQRAALALTGQAATFDTATFSREQRVPIRLLNVQLRLLVRNGYLAEPADQRGCYILLKSPESVRLKEVVDLVLKEGAQPETLGLSRLDPAVANVLGRLDAGMSQTLADMTLQGLLVPANGSA